jgi:hypothetical protein
LHGYLAYRSIRNFLAEQGLAVSVGEAKVVPTPEQWRALTHDEARMNRLLQDASRTPIDLTLPPVILAGNELGLADFFYWSFRIFGLELNSLVLFYYSLLLVSVVLFFLTFRRSPFCLLLLMLYLAVHYFAVNYATIPLIQTVHNSRFFSALSLLPAMHLVLLLLRREPASLPNIAAAAVQAFLLFFVLFCRSQALWQVLAILACVAVVVNYRTIWRSLPHPRLWPGTAQAVAREIWPALLVVCALAGYTVFTAWAPDRHFYRTEAKAHLFWHAFYVGMISTEPELTSRYSYGYETYTDSIGYVAAVHDLRGRNEVLDFAEVADGVININWVKNAGLYDKVVRRIFFQVVTEHPWLVLKSFLIGKPADQFEILTYMAPLKNVRLYVETLGLALAACLIALFAGAGAPDRSELRVAAIALVPLVICSWMTTMIVPSGIIPDVIMFYLLLILLIALYLPLALMVRSIRAAAARRTSP